MQTTHESWRWRWWKIKQSVVFPSYFSLIQLGLNPELAALTGMGDRNAAALYPGRDTPTGRTRNHQAETRPYDPNQDDPLDYTGSARPVPGIEHSQYVVAPSIQVRPEFSSMTRTSDLSQPLTCIVVIELPGKRTAGPVPGPVMADNYGSRNGSGPIRHETSNSENSSPRPEQAVPRQRQHQQNNSQNNHRQGDPESPPRPHTNHPLPSPDDTQFTSSPSGDDSPSYAQNTPQEEDSPFNAITEDLRNRIIDWKGHPLSDLGPLQMYDLLSVRRDSLVREFFVYLFKEAIICVVEEKKRSLGRLLSNASGFTDPGSIVSTSSQSKGVLRLKGRIYVRHIKQVTATSAAGEMSLTIDMEDELASFILIFKDRSSLEAWKNNIQSLVSMFQQQNAPAHPQPQEPARPLDMEEFGGSSKAMRMLSGSTGTSGSTMDSLLNGSARSTMSSSTSHGSLVPQRLQMQNKLSTLGEDDELSNYDSPTGLVTPYTSAGPSNSLSPVPHPPIDLILVVSIPPPTAVPSTAQLKVRVIKTTLDFILASLAQKDRLSLVTFEVGVAGRVRKTPFLAVGKPQSRARLAKFIDELGRVEETQDDFLIRGSKDEKTDVVTAVNHGSSDTLTAEIRNIYQFRFQVLMLYCNEKLVTLFQAWFLSVMPPIAPDVRRWTSSLLEQKRPMFPSTPLAMVVRTTPLLYG